MEQTISAQLGNTISFDSFGNGWGSDITHGGPSSTAEGRSGFTRQGNRTLSSAKAAKQDEFYTQLSDIANELTHYHQHFRGKVVLCNCDDPFESNFFQYFALKFNELGLKKLICTSYAGSPIVRSKLPRQLPLIVFEGLRPHGQREPRLVEISEILDHSQRGIMNRVELKCLLNHHKTLSRKLDQGGDFRSPECVEILKKVDIVVTNPPFSLFREYVAQLMDHEKKFLIIGSMNAVTYKEIFPLFLNNQMWYGASIRSGDREFRVPDDYPITAAGSRVDEYGNKYVRVKGVRWFTNLEYASRHEDLELHAAYNPDSYPKYANFDAIEVGETKNIPFDYDGLMGVPISFLDKYNPRQFEILGSSKTLGLPMRQIAKKGTYRQGGPRFYLCNGDGTYRRMYDRIVIRRKQQP